MIREPGNLPFNRMKAGGVPWPFIDAGALARRLQRSWVRSASNKHPRHTGPGACS